MPYFLDRFQSCVSVYMLMHTLASWMTDYRNTLYVNLKHNVTLPINVV